MTPKAPAPSEAVSTSAGRAVLAPEGSLLVIEGGEMEMKFSLATLVLACLFAIATLHFEGPGLMRDLELRNARLVPARDLKVEEGEWRFEPLNGGRGTRVIYVNRIAANIMAPAMLVREGLRNDTPKVLMNLKRECMAAR